jgi:4-amino-4-deoxy-L-arabinose transferase-like glycosyltransferase
MIRALARRLPIEAILVGLGLCAILVAFVSADPSSRTTFSNSPFTDEAFNTVNARNFAVLGRWSTDDWNLYLVNLPFSVLEGVWLRIVGVGIVQVRLIAIACVSLTAATLVWGLRGIVGRGAAAFAGLAFAASGLVLVYGRLAYLEDLVVLCLTLGAMVLAADERLTTRWGALSGVCFAVAIGAKPSAGFAVAGILTAVLVALGRRDVAARRWAFGAITAIAVAGLAWAVFIWLPNRDAVAIDMKIWAQVGISLSPADLIHSVWQYLRTGNDQLYGKMLGSLLALGAAGLVACGLMRRRLSRTQTRLVLASVGWLVFGFGILAIASYTPNRYVVPLVPPLAIIAATGLATTGQWLSERLGQLAEMNPEAGAGSHPQDGPRFRWVRLAGAALTIAVTVAAVTPGLVWYVSWAHGATYTLPDIQARFASLVPDGERVAGSQSALFMMRSNAITIITQAGDGPANHEDLYRQGVRWYLVPADDPAPPSVPEGAWAARQRVLCAAYGGVTECLFHVP